MSSAQTQGTLWGTRALDWAQVQQPTIWPLCQAVLGEFSPWPGRSLLDIGCGAGEFAAQVSELGARVSGLDASADMIEIARARTPKGRFLIGDMERLPFPDDHFSVVTAINSLHFADDAAAAITEAIRVTRRGGSVVVAAWGPPSECDAVTYLLDLGALMPYQPPGPSASLDPTDLGALEALMDRDGLTLSPWQMAHCPWQYPDLHTALRGLLSTGPAAQAIRHSGPALVANTITGSIAPYRQSDGSYTLNNTCHYLIATAIEEQPFE